MGIWFELKKNITAIKEGTPIKSLKLIFDFPPKG
jgi:hypothetical protein